MTKTGLRMPGVPWSKVPGPLGIQPSSRISTRLEAPAALQASSWKAQVRLCTRYRHLMATGKHAHQVVVAMARALRAVMWAMAKQVAGSPQA